MVGAGPAGMAAALELSRAGAKVVLLESGGGTVDRADLDRGTIDGPGPDPVGPATPGSIHRPGHLARIRRRGLGGAAQLWGIRAHPGAQPRVRLVRPEAPDLVARPRLGVPAFPLTADELAPWLDRAEELLGIPDAPWRAEGAAGALPVSPDVLLPRRFLLPPSSVVTDDLTARVSSDPGVSVRVGTTVRRLQLTPQGDEVSGVEVVHDGGDVEQLRVQQAILAAGAWETVRLLLASGVPDPHDVLGRGVMDHPHGRLGVVAGVDAERLGAFHDFHRVGDLWALGCYRWAPDVLLGGDVPGMAAWLTGERSVVGSTTAAAGARLVNRTSNGMRRVRDAAVVASHPVEAVRYLRVRRHRVPRHDEMVGGWSSPTTALHPVGAATIQVMLEQAPLPGNRVELDPSDLDALGVPRMRVRWSWTEAEIDGYWRTVERVCTALEETGVGHVRTAAELGSPRFPRLSTGAHQLGGTAMSARPDEGVVDLTGHHHQVGGLRVVGGGVLPTSIGHANPTLTIVALALRTAASFASVDRQPS